MKALKITLIVIVSLIVLIFIGAFIASKVINPNDYKPKIEQLVQTNLHRTLTIKGNLSWSFVPWIGVRVNDVSLSNPENFTIQKPFLSVQEADVRIRLLPLIVGKIQFGKIILKGTTVNLLVAPSGKSNWDDFTNSSSAVEKTPVKPVQNIPDKKTEPKENSSFINSIQVGAIDIRDANLYWINQQTNQQLTLTDLNLKASNLNLNNAFPIQLSFKFKQTKPTINFDLNLKGNIQVNLAKEHYAFKNLNLSGTAYQLFHYLKKPLPIFLKGSFAVDLQKQTLSLEDMSAKLANLVLNGDIEGENIVQAPAMKGELTIPSFNARSLFNIFNITVKTPTASLQNIEAHLKFDFSPKFIKVPTLDVEIDQSHLKGELDYANFNAPSINFNLSLDNINLDNYLPIIIDFKPIKFTPSTAKNLSAKKTVPTNTNQQILSTPFLKKLSLNGQISINKIIYRQNAITHFLIKASGSNGKLNLNPIQANLYRGKLQSSLTINVPQSTPLLSMNASLQNTDVSELLRNEKGSSPMSGTLNFSTNVSTSGNTIQTLLNRLNGTGKFSVTGGTLNETNLQSIVMLGLQILKNPALATTSLNLTGKSGVTQFQSLAGTYTIRSGILYNNDLLLSSNALTVKGAGQANLVTDNLNYQCNVTLGKDNPNATAIPITITGKITDPHFGLNMSLLLKNVTQQQIKKQLTRVISPLAPEIGQIGQALSGILAGKK